MKTDDKSFISTLKHGLLAGIASSTSLLSYPLEVLKIRSHVLEEKKSSKNLIFSMYRKEGLRSFYKGAYQNILHGFFGYGTVFLVYELIQQKLIYLSPSTVISNSIISSILGGMAAVTLTSPINFIKTRQILHLSKENQKKSTLSVMQEIYKENKNLQTFWKALNPSLITSFYSAIQISLYQFLKRKFLNDSNENLKLNSVFGLLSRCVACTIIFPFALLRSRMLNKPKQIAEKNESFFTSEFEYKKTFKDSLAIIRREGFCSLFRGLKYELVKVSINGALFFYVYEFLNKKYN